MTVVSDHQEQTERVIHDLATVVQELTEIVEGTITGILLGRTGVLSDEAKEVTERLQRLRLQAGFVVMFADELIEEAQASRRADEVIAEDTP